MKKGAIILGILLLALVLWIRSCSRETIYESPSGAFKIIELQTEFRLTASIGDGGNGSKLVLKNRYDIPLHHWYSEPLEVQYSLDRVIDFGDSAIISIKLDYIPGTSTKVWKAYTWRVKEIPEIPEKYKNRPSFSRDVW